MTKTSKAQTLTLIDSTAAEYGYKRIMTITVVRNGAVDAAERDVDVAMIEIFKSYGQPTYVTERVVGRELDEYLVRHLAAGWSLQL